MPPRAKRARSSAPDPDSSATSTQKGKIPIKLIVPPLSRLSKDKATTSSASSKGVVKDSGSSAENPADEGSEKGEGKPRIVHEDPWDPGSPSPTPPPSPTDSEKAAARRRRPRPGYVDVSDDDRTVTHAVKRKYPGYAEVPEDYLQRPPTPPVILNGNGRPVRSCIKPGAASGEPPSKKSRTSTKSSTHPDQSLAPSTAAGHRPQSSTTRRSDGQRVTSGPVRNAKLRAPKPSQARKPSTSYPPEDEPMQDSFTTASELLHMPSGDALPPLAAPIAPPTQPADLQKLDASTPEKAKLQAPTVGDPDVLDPEKPDVSPPAPPAALTSGNPDTSRPLDPAVPAPPMKPNEPTLPVKPAALSSDRPDTLRPLDPPVPAPLVRPVTLTSDKPDTSRPLNDATPAPPATPDEPALPVTPDEPVPPVTPDGPAPLVTPDVPAPPVKPAAPTPDNLDASPPLDPAAPAPEKHDTAPPVKPLAPASDKPGSGQQHGQGEPHVGAPKGGDMDDSELDDLGGWDAQPTEPLSPHLIPRDDIEEGLTDDVIADGTALGNTPPIKARRGPLSQEDYELLMQIVTKIFQLFADLSKKTGKPFHVLWELAGFKEISGRAKNLYNMYVKKWAQQPENARRPKETLVDYVARCLSDYHSEVKNKSTVEKLKMRADLEVWVTEFDKAVVKESLSKGDLFKHMLSFKLEFLAMCQRGYRDYGIGSFGFIFPTVAGDYKAKQVASMVAYSPEMAKVISSRNNDMNQFLDGLTCTAVTNEMSKIKSDDFSVETLERLKKGPQRDARAYALKGLREVLVHLKLLASVDDKTPWATLVKGNLLEDMVFIDDWPLGVEPIETSKKLTNRTSSITAWLTFYFAWKRGEDVIMPKVVPIAPRHVAASRVASDIDVWRSVPLFRRTDGTSALTVGDHLDEQARIEAEKLRKQEEERLRKADAAAAAASALSIANVGEHDHPGTAASTTAPISNKRAGRGRASDRKPPSASRRNKSGGVKSRGRAQASTSTATSKGEPLFLSPISEDEDDVNTARQLDQAQPSTSSKGEPVGARVRGQASASALKNGAFFTSAVPDDESDDYMELDEVTGDPTPQREKHTSHVQVGGGRTFDKGSDTFSNRSANANNIIQDDNAFGAPSFLGGSRAQSLAPTIGTEGQDQATMPAPPSPTFSLRGGRDRLSVPTLGLADGPALRLPDANQGMNHNNGQLLSPHMSNGQVIPAVIGPQIATAGDMGSVTITAAQYNELLARSANQGPASFQRDAHAAHNGSAFQAGSYATSNGGTGNGGHVYSAQGSSRPHSSNSMQDGSMAQRVVATFQGNANVNPTFSGNSNAFSSGGSMQTGSVGMVGNFNALQHNGASQNGGHSTAFNGGPSLSGHFNGPHNGNTSFSDGAARPGNFHAAQDGGAAQEGGASFSGFSSAGHNNRGPSPGDFNMVQSGGMPLNGGMPLQGHWNTSQPAGVSQNGGATFPGNTNTVHHSGIMQDATATFQGGFSALHASGMSQSIGANLAGNASLHHASAYGTPAHSALHGSRTFSDDTRASFPAAGSAMGFSNAQTTAPGSQQFNVHGAPGNQASFAGGQQQFLPLPSAPSHPGFAQGAGAGQGTNGGAGWPHGGAGANVYGGAGGR